MQKGRASQDWKFRSRGTKTYDKFLHSFTAFFGNLASGTFRRRNFLERNFCEAWAPRSVCKTTRGGQKIMQSKLRSRPFLGTSLPEPFVAEIFGWENFCRARAPRSVCNTTQGGKNRKKFLGFTAFLGNLASGTFRRRNFYVRKFLRSIGATQRLQAQRGGPKIMQRTVHSRRFLGTLPPERSVEEIFL